MRVGTLLMALRSLDCNAYRRITADVGGAHATSDGSIDWSFGKISAMICAGRTQATCFLKRWLWGKAPSAIQEYWSRGCPRAHVLSSVFACWRLLPHVPRKKNPSPLWKSRYQPSLPTLANTSDLMRRADRGNPGWRAVFSGKFCKSAGFIRAVGLSVRSVPMLKTGAVPPIQDRSLC